MDLLRWFRFCWAIEVPWDQATRSEARDFCRWLQLADKPAASPRTGAGSASGLASRGAGAQRGEPGDRQATAGRSLCGGDGGALRDGAAAVLRLSPGGRDRADGEPVPAGPAPRAGARRTTTRWTRSRDERAGLFRPRVPQRVPRSIPDEQFNELFARLGSHRDRALVAFWVSTGARASELLGAPPGSRSGPAADHGDPQGNPGDAAAPGVAGRVRVAAALPGGDAAAWCRRAGRAAVVDAAAPVPAADLSRGPGMFARANAALGSGLDAARSAPYRRLPDGPRPGRCR